MSATVSLPASSATSVTSTLAPAAANASALARPMPVPAPVTSATRPSMSMFMLTPYRFANPDTPSDGQYDAAMKEFPRIISVDDHVVEPANVWMDRLPSKYKDVGPRVVRAPVKEITFIGGKFS